MMGRMAPERAEENLNETMCANSLTRSLNEGEVLLGSLDIAQI